MMNLTLERVLWMRYQDYESFFGVLLTRNGSVCIHAKN